MGPLNGLLHPVRKKELADAVAGKHSFNHQQIFPGITGVKNTIFIAVKISIPLNPINIT